MINYIYKRIKRITSLKSMLLFSAAFILVLYIINGKPFGVARLKELTGVGILDLERYYSPEYAYKILELQGDIGREFYKKLMIRLDFILPLSYTLAWTVLITYIFSKWLSPDNRLQKLSLIPILAGISDFVENIFFLIMITNYPIKLYSIAHIANIMTILKGIFTLVSMIMIVVGVFGLLHKRFFLQKNRSEN